MEIGATTVLLVDDDPAMRDSLDFLLGAAGFEVRLFESAQTFLTELPGLEPGCVVTDIRMPGMDGVELARHLARLPTAPAVIFVTAFDQYAVQALSLIHI